MILFTWNLLVKFCVSWQPSKRTGEMIEVRLLQVHVNMTSFYMYIIEASLVQACKLLIKLFQ